MASPDPAVRDGWAYRELAEGILAGRFADDLAEIRRRILTHVDHPQAQARTFAPLVLCRLLRAGERDRSMFEACARWYVHESDTRGYDPELGWLHAVAHGADCLGWCVQVGIAEAEEVFAVLAARTTTEADVWGDQEEARIAAAIVRILRARPDADLGALFGPLTTALTEAERAFAVAEAPFMPPRWLANLQALAHTLYVCGREPVLLDWLIRA